jgi:hypothetical protein
LREAGRYAVQGFRVLGGMLCVVTPVYEGAFVTKYVKNFVKNSAIKRQ